MSDTAARPGLRRHSRTTTVQRAESHVHDALLVAMDAYDLSWTEAAVMLSSLTTNALKYALRDQRHPHDPERKADEK